MKIAEYKRTPGWKLVGRKARVNRIISNGIGAIQPGGIVEIKRKFKGFEILSEPCGECKVSLRIVKVPPSALDLLSKEECEQKGLV